MYIFIRCFANEYKPLHIIYKRFLSRTTESAIVGYEKFPKIYALFDDCRLSFCLYRILLQILIYKLFGNLSSTIKYPCDCGFRRARAFEKVQTYFTTITSYVILILIYNIIVLFAIMYTCIID